jgi:hypothetical protein
VSEAFKEHGNALYRAERWDEAAVWYSLATVVDPCNWRALSNRASCSLLARKLPLL